MCPKINTSSIWQRHKRYGISTGDSSLFKEGKSMPIWLKNPFHYYGEHMNSDKSANFIKSKLHTNDIYNSKQGTLKYNNEPVVINDSNNIQRTFDKSSKLKQMEQLYIKDKNAYKKQDEFNELTNKFTRPSNIESVSNNISENRESDNFQDDTEKEFVLYELGDTDIWFKTEVQLLEKLSTPEGKTIWKDITQQDSAWITSSRPEWGNQYLNIRYGSTDYVPREDFTLPPTGICLLLSKDEGKNDRLKNDKFGDFIIVPFEDIEIIEGNSNHGENLTTDVSSSLKGKNPRRIMVRLSKALIGRNQDGYKIVNEGSDIFLRIPYRQPHHAQIDLEARADENQLVYIGSSGRLTTAVSENTRRTRAILIVQVTNTGLAAARFRPRIRECGLETVRKINEDEIGISVDPVMIPPLHTHRFRIELPMDRTGDVSNCLVVLLNDNDESVAVREVRIKRGDRCFCIWHCQCVCLNDDPKLLCQEMAEYQQVAAGLSPRERPRQVRAACYPNVVTINLLVIFMGVIFILLALGLLKACIGLFLRCVGSWGIDQMLQTPRRLDHYYEHNLRDRDVIFDDDGWPVHPDTKKRTVRLISKSMEFVLNVIFFVTMPCIVLWNSLNQIISHLNNKENDTDIDRKVNRRKHLSSQDMMQTKEARWRWRRARRKRGLSRWMTSHAEALSTDIWRNGLAPQGLYQTECMRPLLQEERYQEKLYDLQTSVGDSEHDDTEYVLTQMRKSKESLSRTQQNRGSDMLRN